MHCWLSGAEFVLSPRGILLNPRQKHRLGLPLRKMFDSPRSTAEHSIGLLSVLICTSLKLKSKLRSRLNGKSTPLQILDCFVFSLSILPPIVHFISRCYIEKKYCSPKASLFVSSLFHMTLHIFCFAFIFQLILCCSGGIPLLDRFSSFPPLLAHTRSYPIKP